MPSDTLHRWAPDDVDGLFADLDTAHGRGRAGAGRARLLGRRAERRAATARSTWPTGCAGPSARAAASRTSWPAPSRRRALRDRRDRAARTRSAPTSLERPAWSSPPTAAGGSTSASPPRAPSTGGSTCWRPTTPEALATPHAAPCCPASDRLAVKDPVVVHARRHAGTPGRPCHPLDDPDPTDRMTTEHATSDDGVDWTWHGTALAGRPGQWDARGVRVAAVCSTAPGRRLLRRPRHRRAELGGAHRPGRASTAPAGWTRGRRPAGRRLAARRSAACATSAPSGSPTAAPGSTTRSPAPTAPTTCAPFVRPREARR